MNDDTSKARSATYRNAYRAEMEKLRTAETEEVAGREDALLDFYHEVMVRRQALLDIPTNF